MCTDAYLLTTSTANQIRGFTIDHGKFILIDDRAVSTHLLCITTLHNGLKTQALLFRPVRSKTKTNCESVGTNFLALRASYVYLLGVE